MESKLDIGQIIHAASIARQLTALLQNIFENGTGIGGCPHNDELIGLSYDISGKVSLFLDELEKQEDK
ncbi:hypothetical protein [Erwinia rhapontici]|uniref:hypothetical protein n=1 Tax=Erwinia rhapontici TaxID=55212 RepID=UPI00105BA1BA|nr:hypothetical protein [Erwinia rhapontici]TDT01653.1 hypothetical protein EDF84_101380 [Erwinia rhapontici]